MKLKRKDVAKELNITSGFFLIRLSSHTIFEIILIFFAVFFHRCELNGWIGRRTCSYGALT